MRRVLLLSLSLLLLLPGSASAVTILGDAVSLACLLMGDTLTAGDKQFDGFSYLSTGDMPDASGVNVVAIQDDDGNYGIRFQGGFTDLASTVGASDALISYSVTVTNPDNVITAINTSGNPTLIGGAGSISVVGTVSYDENERILIFDDESAGTQSSDVVGVPGLSTFAVTNDILTIVVPADPGTATLSYLDQTFTQQAVPEPATISLLGLAVLVVGRRR